MWDRSCSCQRLAGRTECLVWIEMRPGAPAPAPTVIDATCTEYSVSLMLLGGRATSSSRSDGQLAQRAMIRSRGDQVGEENRAQCLPPGQFIVD